jgi:hypothetical protein
MCHIVICGLSGSTVFFHIIPWTARFSETAIEHKMCVLTLSTPFVWNIFHSRKKCARYDHKRIIVKYPSISSNFNKMWIFYTDFRKISYSNIKFHKNPSSGSRVVPCALTYGRTDTVAFRNLCNASKKHTSVFFTIPFNYRPIHGKVFQMASPFRPLRLNSVQAYTAHIFLLYVTVLLLGEQQILQRITFVCSKSTELVRRHRTLRLHFPYNIDTTITRDQQSNSFFFNSNQTYNFF